MRGQSGQHVVKVRVRVVTVDLCWLHETHGHGGALAGRLTACGQPCFSCERPWPNQILAMVVVHVHLAFEQIARQRAPKRSSCSSGLGCGTAAVQTGRFQLPPRVQLFPQRLRDDVPAGQALLARQRSRRLACRASRAVTAQSRSEYPSLKSLAKPAWIVSRPLLNSAARVSWNSALSTNTAGMHARSQITPR
jgi:hypothetical protein